MTLRIRNLIRRILPQRRTVAKPTIVRRELQEYGGRDRAAVHEVMAYRTPWARRGRLVAWTEGGQIVRAFDPATRQVWEAVAA